MQLKPTTVIICILGIFGLRLMVHHLFDPTVHKSEIYIVGVPEGWKKVVEGNEVKFLSPKQNQQLGMPEAIFSVFAYKATTALFMEEFFYEVIKSYHEAGGKIIDKGDIKIDGIQSKWILYEHPQPKMLMLSFFTVDDWNRLTRVQYITTPELFATYRPEFEAWRETVDIKTLF